RRHHDREDRVCLTSEPGDSGSPIRTSSAAGVLVLFDARILPASRVVVPVRVVSVLAWRPVGVGQRRGLDVCVSAGMRAGRDNLLADIPP
ncbi:hypothetical protein EV182_008859, partial [Spiromyces aspiralis]